MPKDLEDQLHSVESNQSLLESGVGKSRYASPDADQLTMAEIKSGIEAINRNLATKHITPDQLRSWFDSYDAKWTTKIPGVRRHSISNRFWISFDRDNGHAMLEVNNMLPVTDLFKRTAVLNPSAALPLLTSQIGALKVQPSQAEAERWLKQVDPGNRYKWLNGELVANTERP